MLSMWLDQLKAAWPPNRVVALLTPLVFVPVAGFVAAWVAKHFPGIPPIDPAHITAIFIAGGLAALQVAYKWLSGWQLHEARLAEGKDVPKVAGGGGGVDIQESDMDDPDKPERSPRTTATE